MDILNSLILFSAFFGLFLSIALFVHRRGNTSANKLLAILVFILTLIVAKHIDFGNSSQLISSILALASPVFMFMFGPLLLFYAKDSFGNRTELKKGLAHFIPALSSIVVIIAMAITAKKVNNGQMVINKPLISSLFFVFLLTQIVHMLIYNIKVYKYLNIVQRALRQSFSNIDKINFRWLKHATIGFTIILCMSIGYYVMLITGGYYTYSQETDFGFVLMVSIMINYIGLRSLRQPEIISGELLNQAQSKYNNSRLSKELAEQYKSQIINYMNVDSPYTDSDFKLNDMASRLGLSSHMVSQVINEYLSQNFFEFINSYRINLAKEKMKAVNWKTNTILGIAFDVGYNSKSAFNRAFKRIENRTPSDYLKSLK